MWADYFMHDDLSFVFAQYQESLMLFVMRNWETSLSLLGLNIWLIRKLA